VNATTSQQRMQPLLEEYKGGQLDDSGIGPVDNCYTPKSVKARHWLGYVCAASKF